MGEVLMLLRFGIMLVFASVFLGCSGSGDDQTAEEQSLLSRPSDNLESLGLKPSARKLPIAPIN